MQAHIVYKIGHNAYSIIARDAHHAVTLYAETYCKGSAVGRYLVKVPGMGCTVECRVTWEGVIQ